MNDVKSVAVRQAGPGDLALLKRLRLASLADAPDAFLTTLAGEEAMTDAAWQERLDSNVAGERTKGFFALVDGEAQGLVVGVRRPDRADSVNLNALWVAPAARGRGTGRALVDAVAAWARECGCRRVTLAVIETNADATALYRACGFEETTRVTRDDPDRPRTEVGMALEL